jgi:hypothetical protein
MFLLYHSKGYNICELVLHECYVNDLYTTTCSGMLGHHIYSWAKVPLSDKQVLYAALDARLGFEIARRYYKLQGYNSHDDHLNIMVDDRS